MSMLLDIGAIKDEDLLRRMWQETDDFCRKKEIRAHMYKLRETRLRDFYSGDMDAGIGLSKTPLTASHGDSLADQSFQSFKTKEIRDSESPTREFKYGVPANLGGWNIMTSSELSNDGKMHTAHSLATTGGVHDLADGQAKFTGRNEKISSVAFDGDDKNYTTSSGENTNTVLEENIVQGNENNRRVENKKSTVTTSSKILRSHYESGDNGFNNEPQYAPSSETFERKIIYNEAPQPRVMSQQQQPNNNGPRNNLPASNTRSEQLISRTVEYPDPHTKVIREVTSLPDGSTITTTKYETRSANSELWTSSNTSKNTSSSTSRVVKEDRAEHNRIQYIIDDRGNQVPYQPNRHVQNKTTKDVEGYEIIIDTTTDRNVPITKTVKKDLTRDMERLTDQNDVVRTTATTTTTETNRNNDVYDIKRQTNKVDRKPIETEYTRKRISVDLDPTHEAFARSLRCVSPVSDRDSIRSHRSATSSIRSSISPDKGFRARRSNSRDTDISQISSQTITKSGPTPGLKSPQRASTGKRPDTTTATIKTEKIIRIPGDRKPDNQTPRQPSQVTDLDSDDTTETKITTVTTTTTENKDRPKPNRPPFVRSETYEERCRKILGMPEPDEQPKSPVTCRSKFTTTTTDFIENEKVDIAKNRTVATDRQTPNSPEKSRVGKLSGRPTRDETTVDTNTFDRKTPRRPESSLPDRKPGAKPGDESTQRRPNENVPDNKSPSLASPNRRSPSKIIETITTTVTHKSPRGHSPGRKTPNRESSDHKPSKIVETTKTISRDTPRRSTPGDDRVSPDRKSPSRRPNQHQGLPDRKTVVTKNVKNLGKYDDEINETIVDRKQPRRPTNKPDESDEELIDVSEPEYETIERKPARRPTEELVSDDETPNRPHKIVRNITGTDNNSIKTTTKSINTFDQGKPRGPLSNEPETDEEITETVITETLFDRKQPSPSSKITEEVIETTTLHKTPRRPIDGPRRPTDYETTTGPRKTPRRPNDGAPDYETPNHPSRTTETDEEFLETAIIQKTQRRPNDSLSKIPNTRKIPSNDHPTKFTTKVVETDEETRESTVTRKTQRRPNDETPDRQSPDRQSHDRRSPDYPSPLTEEITETTITRKTPQHTKDVPLNKIPDRRSPGRPSKFTSNVNEVNKETVESHVSRKTQRLANDESPDRQTPNRTVTDRQSPDRKLEATSHVTQKTAEDTIESNVTRRHPKEESPDRLKTRTDRSSKTPDRQSPGRTVPERRSPDCKFSTTTNIIETDEDTIESTVTRPASDRRSPVHPSHVTEEITETITSRKTPRYPEDCNPIGRSSKTPDRQSPGRTVPDRRSPDRTFSTTTNIIETNEDTIESTLTRRRPNEESPDRLTTRPASDRRSPGHPSQVTEEITETITSRKTPHYPDDRNLTGRSSKTPEITEDRTPNQRSPDRSAITSNVIGTNEEFINTTTVTRKTPDRQSPGRTVPDRRSPVRNVTDTDEETIESTVSRTTNRRENQELPDRQSPERTVNDRCSPERPSTITTKVSGIKEKFVETSTAVSRKSPDRQSPGRTLQITETVVSRKNPHHPEDDSPDRKSPNRRSSEATSPVRQSTGRIVNKTETVVSRKTPRLPEDDSPDRKLPNRRSPERLSPDRQSTGRTVHKTETIVSRKTPRRQEEDSPDRKSPNRRSPERLSPDRQSSGRTVHKTETVVSRKTPRRPEEDSPDRKSPNRRSPERLSPDRQSTGRTVHKTETVVSRKTPRRPEEDSPDRKSLNRRSPERLSPDRQSTGRTVHKTETVVSRKTPRRPEDDSPDRKSPNRRSPERLSPDRQSSGRTVHKTETVVSRKTPRRPEEDSPDRKSPNHRSPERLSPDRQSTGRTVHNTETVVSRKTSRRPEEDSPDRKSPNRRSPGRLSPDRQSTGRTVHKTEIVVSRKTPRRPEDDSPDRKSPNRRSPDRPSSRTINVTGNNEESVKTTATRKTVDRQSPRRTLPDHRSPDRPKTYTSNVNEIDDEVVATTVTQKTQQRPNDGIPVCSLPDRRSPDRKTTISSTRSPATDTEIIESTHSRKTYRQPNDESPDRRSPGRRTPKHRSPDLPSKTTTNRQKITETTVTRENQQRPNDDSPDRTSSRKSPTKVTETKITRTIPWQSEKSPDRPYRTTRNRTDTDEELVETNVTGKTLRRPNDGSPERRSPDRKTIDRPERPFKISKEITETTTVISKTQKHPTTRSPERKTSSEKPRPATVDNTSPVRSSKITTNRNDEEYNETIVSTRKIQRHPTDESPERKNPTRKTITTVTKTTTGRRPTPTYTDETPSLRRKPVSKSPEEIVESDEPIDELTTNRHRGDINREPGYLRPTQSSRPKVQSPDRKISTATYINEENEEIRETSIKRRPGYEQPDQSDCEPVNRRPVSKIPDVRSPDRKSSSTNITRRPLSEDKSPTRRISRTRSPDQDENEPVHRLTTKKTIISQQPERRSPERRTSDESEIDDETVQINQYEEFIQNEMDATETNRQPGSERPGPLRRKPDDVEVIFERALDITNVTEVDNVLVEEKRAVGCKLTGEPDEPKRRPQESSPMKRQPYESSPGRRTTLKKSSKFDDETEEITTTVEQRTIRRPTVSETSPDRRTSRPTKPRSPETSPIRPNIVKTVKEIIISPTQPRRVLKQPRSPETSPTRRTTHITTITKTIPDRSTPTMLSKSRPQTTPPQPGQKKPNIDRINSEIITDRDEKRTTSTTIRSKQKTAPEIVPSIVQRYTTKTESPVSRPIKRKPVESTPETTEVIEEVFVKKEVKKLCDGDVCGPRPLTNGTLPTKRIVPKQETPVRPSNTTTTQTNKRTSVTERKNTAPIIPSNRVPATDKFGRSASENQIRTPNTPKIEVDEPVTKERRPSLKSKTARPTKCIATKTINITNTNLTVDSDEMDIVIDIQQAKSSREPSPNKIIPVPVSPETDTGPSRYPDNVTEPEDERKPRRKVTNVPIFEEETNTFVSCDITEVSSDHVPHYEDLEEGNVDDSDDDVDHDRIVKVTDNDECLLSVSDKVSRFINLADETVTSKVTTKKTEIDRRRPITKDLENDDCLLSVSDKVSKFITTAEEFKKPKASIDFVTIEKINETENRLRPETTEDEEIDDEEVEENIRVDETNRLNARKVTKVVEKNPSETVITTTTTTTTRKVKPVVTRPLDEEITVNRPKKTKVSTIASKFTKPNDQLSRQSSIKRITTDTKVSSIRTKFDKNVEHDDGADEPTDEELDTRGREPFFLNQNGTNNQQIETISKIVQSSYVDQVPDDHQTPPRGSITDRFKPTTEGSKMKKITPTPILQSTEVMKKAKEIFENKPNDRPKQIDILSRPSVWKFKTNDVKLTDIGVHTTKTTKTTEEIETSDEEVESQPEVPKTPKLSARDEFTLKNLRDVTNISSKKDLFERKFSSDRITTTNTTTNREFSESPVGGSPTSNKPSYMNHTVSSLEHINRRDSRSQITSDHESIDDNNSINSNKFGVELRRVDSQNATKTRRKSSSTEIPCVEEIWDLELLERMLETVVGYEHRRRIRSQIRIIKKQIEEEEMHTSHHHQTTSSEITTNRISKERTRSPATKRNETTTAPKSQPARQISPMRTVTKTTRVLDEPDQKVSKIVTKTTTITKGDITDDGKPIWTKKNLLKKPSETQIKTPISATTTSSSTTRKYNTSSYREVEKTDSVTSSYGIGPTDENGKPLFGIRALKKQAQKTEYPKEPVYSTDSDPYQTDDQIRRIAKSINLRAPQKIREGYQSARTTTVKKSTKNFIQHEIDDEPVSGTEEIEEYEYESKDRAATKLTKNVESFLGSEKTYTGFNDVIDRMRNADHVQVEGDTESDREARALLNKFLGASILVQATESVLPDGVKVTQKTTRTLKSDSPVATSATRQVTTTKLTKVKSSNNSKDSSCNNTGAVATTITTTAVNDIDSIWDESYLRKLLEQSSSYEERRKIRARIRQIMADKEGGKTTTEIVKETKKDDDAGVTTTTTKVTTRTVTASKPVSPFAKFRQLDKASTQSPPNSPHTPNTPKTPGQTSAPIFKFTDPALNRRVATFKEQLLQWCQFKTREYENVKIENFSTSWSDGLAFCALIHHFRPDAFDYTKLVATQRRYNFDLAFRVADEKAGIAPLLDVEDMVVMRKPDWKCVFTYVQSIYRRFKDAD